jgi:DNA-binding CsgD family transcriptional regulator
MEALAQFGVSKLAARALGISLRTLETHVNGARRKLSAPNRLLAVLAYDRWKRGVAS